MSDWRPTVTRIRVWHWTVMTLAAITFLAGAQAIQYIIRQAPWSVWQRAVLGTVALIAYAQLAGIGWAGLWPNMTMGWSDVYALRCFAFYRSPGIEAVIDSAPPDKLRGWLHSTVIDMRSALSSCDVLAAQLTMNVDAVVGEVLILHEPMPVPDGDEDDRVCRECAKPAPCPTVALLSPGMAAAIEALGPPN